MGGVFTVENDRALVTLGGWLGDHAPADEAGFLEFARSLPDPAIYNFLRQAEPLTDFAVHKFPSNLRRHYETMKHWPEGYLVAGDAMCSFNPIYGQGMTVSALAAQTLDECLKEHQRGGWLGLSQRYFRKVAKLIDVPWALAAGEDFRYPEVEGEKRTGIDLINWYVAKVHQAATRSSAVNHAFLQVMNLLEPPAILFKPSVVLNVIKANLAGLLTAAPTPVRLIRIDD
jgi:2-polyprenyl-6-methoxyphenol hydroxylase-like FAD-dependent oxidoreductase